MQDTYKKQAMGTPTCLTDMPAEILKELDAHKKEVRLSKGQFVYRVGEVPKGIFLLRQGLVGLTLVSENGNNYLLRLFSPGQIFGHRSFAANEPYHATATCLENSLIDFYPRHIWEKCLRQSPELCFLIMRKMALELRMAEISKLSLSEKEVPCRIAEGLVYLKNASQDHMWTRREIAEFVGSTTATVIRNLAKLESLGLIKQVGRRIEIPDQKKLLEQAQRASELN